MLILKVNLSGRVLTKSFPHGSAPKLNERVKDEVTGAEFEVKFLNHTIRPNEFVSEATLAPVLNERSLAERLLQAGWYEVPQRILPPDQGTQ